MHRGRMVDMTMMWAIYMMLQLPHLGFSEGDAKPVHHHNILRTHDLTD